LIDLYACYIYVFSKTAYVLNFSI